MQFSTNINMDNAAFDDDDGRTEVARILTALAGSLTRGDDCGSLSDINGNTVGSWQIDGDRAGAETTPVAYHVLDVDGDSVAVFTVQEHLGHEDARHDAQREAEAMLHSHMEGLSATDKALAKFNDTPYVVAVEYANGEITTKGVW